MSRAEVGYRHVCGQRRRAWHTRGRGHGNRHTLADGGAEPGIPANGGTGIVLLRAAAWAWICRPFPGVLSAGLSRCWYGRKKKVTGKSGFTEFRPPQPPGCNPQIISKVNPMWQGRKKQKFCHFREHAPENDIFLPVCAWASFPLARNGRHRRFSGAAHAPCGATFAQAIEPARRAIPPGRRGFFFHRQSPRGPKRTRGAVSSLFYSRAAGEITPRSAGSPRTPCSRGDT